MTREDRGYWLAIAGLLALPAAHPLLIPFIGVPSHLLWWVHVLPVAMVAFRLGRVPAAAIALGSGALVVVGERIFGAGYGTAAPWETVWSLTVALLATHALVAGFALYARAAAGRYRLLFDNATSAILRTDFQGRIIAANVAALELFKCKVEHLIGKTFGEVEFFQDLPDPDDLARRDWFGTITVGCGEDERVAHVAVAAAKSEDPPSYQVLLVDRTNQVAQERELERQSRLATLGGTLAGVAHELKNPLQVMTGYSELGLAPGATPEEVRESLETIRGAAERMTGMVQELLGFSRTREESERVIVADLVKRILRIQRLARSGSVRIREDVIWTGQARLSAAKLEQILTNLISNALDAVPASDGVVDVTVDRIDRQVLIEVADNGPGVPPDLLQRVFEPFVTTKPEGSGTGLGLAISRRLAADMGGELTVANRPNGGAAFTLRLPMAPQASGAPDDRAVEVTA